MVLHFRQVPGAERERRHLDQLEFGAGANGREGLPLRQPIRQRLVSVHARLARQVQRLAVSVVLHHLFSNLVQGRNLARELLVQGDYIYAVHAQYRPGKRVLRRPGKRLRREIGSHLQFLRSIFAVKRRRNLDD